MFKTTRPAIATAVALAVTAVALTSPTGSSRHVAASAELAPAGVHLAGAGHSAPAAPAAARTATNAGPHLLVPGRTTAKSSIVTLTPAESRASVLAAHPPKDAEGEHGESGGNPTSPYLVTLHGGAVQTAPHIYLVLWGSSWSTSSGDPYGVANILHYMYSGLSGSHWASPLTQYTSSYGNFTNPSGQYRGWIKIATAIPTRPTSAQLQSAVAQAAKATGDYSYNAQYVIAMPWGVVDTGTWGGSISTAACAWHATASLNGSWVTYTALPYTPYLDQLYKSYGTGCGGNFVNGTKGVTDGVTINAGHEYAETVSDPGMNGWFDVSGAKGEVGDKCAWTNLGNRPLANGYTFPMQPIWSNAYRNTYGNGCYFAA